MQTIGNISWGSPVDAFCRFTLSPQLAKTCHSVHMEGIDRLQAHEGCRRIKDQQPPSFT